MNDDTQSSDPERIIANFCKRLPIDIRGITDSLEACILGALERRSALRDIEADMHRLSGAAACMGFPFFAQQMSDLHSELQNVNALREPASEAQIRHFAMRIQAIAKLAHYTIPQNSVLLRTVGGQTENLKKSRSERNLQFRTVMNQQRVLFADDDKTIQMLMRDILRNIQVGSCETAGNGEELVGKIPGFLPTIIITDWKMEPLNGLEFLRMLRSGALKIRPDLPVIFLSSQQTIGHVHTAITEGADHFLVKPFSIGMVEKAIYKMATRTGPKRDLAQLSA